MFWVQLKGTVSFANSLMSFTISDILGENLDKQLVIPINDCTCFLFVGADILMIVVTLFLSGLPPVVV